MGIEFVAEEFIARSIMQLHPFRYSSVNFLHDSTRKIIPSPNRKGLPEESDITYDADFGTQMISHKCIICFQESSFEWIH
jgi:hypothetical protein